MALSFTEWKSTLFLCSVSTVILGLVFATLSPSIAGGDSGELVAEGCILGTAHPPGYPLFTVLVFAITQVREWLLWCVQRFVASPGRVSQLSKSLGSIAFQVNIFSAMLTVGAAHCMGLIVSSVSQTRKESGGKLLGGSVVAMGMFTFSPLIWQYAVTAEVFPLNTFFAALILLLVLKFAQHGNFWIAVLGAFVCGLALCNQHTIVLYEAPLILYMAFLLRARLFAKPIHTCLSLGCAFLLGLLPYVYLPIAGGVSPKHGSWGNVGTWDGFLHHFLRRDYGTFTLFSGEQGKNAEGFWVRNKAYLRDSFEVQGLYCAPILALLALVLWRRVVDPDIARVTADSTVFVGGSSIAAEKSTPVPPPSSGKGSSGPKKQKQQNPKESRLPSPSTSLAVSLGDCQVSSIEANWAPWVFLATQIFYFCIFHRLANLPLHNKLLYGIHQRFWMQPNVMLFTWAGIGFNEASQLIGWTLSWLSNSIWSNRARKGPVSPTHPAAAAAAAAEAQRSASSAETSASKRQLLPSLIATLNIVGSLVLVSLQYRKWYSVSNQSGATHWKDYASAILEPLPRNSVLLINYDMQWTSVRYIQKCEKFRDDVIAINLSMMTYTWFVHKHKLYPTLKWPGTYLAAPNDQRHQKNNPFTLKSFLDANTGTHPVFLGGKVNYPDPSLEEHYTFAPAGLVTKIVPISRSPNATAYNNWNRMNWMHVTKNLASLPDMVKYPEETWEWTINRDFRDRVQDTSAFLLERAIQIANEDPQPLVDAMYWLETSALLEQTGPRGLERNLNSLPAALAKNTGLGHVYLLQNKALDKDQPLTISYDFFQSAKVMGWPEPGKDWKLWAAEQFAAYWGAFVEMPDARKDPQFETIKETWIKATRPQPKP